MLRLKLLGGLAVEGQPDLLTGRAAQKKRLAVLAVIAMAPDRSSSRDKVTALLWPESDADRARHQLSSSVHELRRALGDRALVATRDGLQLDADVRCDVAEFREAIGRGDWHAAIDLYRGPFLDGVHLSAAPEFERWVDAERAMLARELAHALEERAAQCEKCGDMRGAVACWQRLTAADPLNSRLVLGLMRALAAAGDRAGAIRMAAHHESLLLDDGVPADPEVRRVAAELRAPAPCKTSTTKARAADAAPPEELDAVVPTMPVSDPTPVSHRLPRSRRAVLGVAAAVLALVSVASFMRLPHGTNNPRDHAVPENAAAPMRIAVTPLVAIDTTRRAAMLSAGLSEELHFALSRIPDLQLLGRSSTSSLERSGADRAAAMARIGVRWLLEGSLREQGDTVRVTVRLLDARSGFEEWSERFVRPLGDALTLQQEIAARVASRVMLGGHGDHAAGAVPRTSTAVEHYLRGRFLLRERSVASQQRAIDAFGAALSAAPDYARAHAAMSEAYNAIAEMTWAGGEQETWLQRAETSARRAIALDSSLGEGQTSLGNVLLNQWRWAESREAFRRGVAANPGLAVAYQRYGIALALQGVFGEAAVMTHRATELDPLDPGTHATHAYVLVLARRFDEAERVALGMLATDSTSESSHFWMATALLHQGRLDDAVHHFSVARGYAATPQRALPMLGYTLARAGRIEDARRLRDTIARGMADKSMSPYHAAAYFATIGERERAFGVLTALAGRKESCLRDLGVDPLMAPLHDDARFTRVVSTVGSTLVTLASR